ncbi:hypothetical protein LTR53_015057 [Teratosphaeriaceae sp. CCFEE 6253]|nr:hypothetical protein LTR53_015057 [Teratosphaeriaceae sp. CCFEE 6253]
MALGDSGGKKLDWPAVKQICSSADIDRLACLGMVYLNSTTVDRVKPPLLNHHTLPHRIHADPNTTIVQSKYAEAAKQFGGSIKPESYQRGLWVISKKLAEAQGGSAPSTPAKGSAKKSGKRVASEAADQDDEEPETPKRARKGTAGAKRGKSSTAESAPPSPKIEEDGHELDGVFA